MSNAANGTTTAPRLSWKRVLFFIMVVVSGVAGGYFWGDYVRQSDRAAEHIAVIFSILAASLFAVISIVGDPGMLVRGGAKEAWSNARAIQSELYRFNLLFYLYLITLALLVASETISQARLWHWYWLSNVFTAFATSTFLYSLSLPLDFMALQKRRLEQEISARTKGRA